MACLDSSWKNRLIGLNKTFQVRKTDQCGNEILWNYRSPPIVISTLKFPWGHPHLKMKIENTSISTMLAGNTGCSTNFAYSLNLAESAFRQCWSLRPLHLYPVWFCPNIWWKHRPKQLIIFVKLLAYGNTKQSFEITIRAKWFFFGTS